MASKQAGTGKAMKVIQGGDIGASIVPTRPSDQEEDRAGFTKKRTITHIGPYAHGKGLAGPPSYCPQCHCNPCACGPGGAY
jgi:hypothetical protein